jgi:hypothetical protein
MHFNSKRLVDRHADTVLDHGLCKLAAVDEDHARRHVSRVRHGFW